MKLKPTSYQIRCLVPTVMTSIYRLEKKGKSREWVVAFQSPADHVGETVRSSIQGPLHRFEERIL